MHDYRNKNKTNIRSIVTGRNDRWLRLSSGLRPYKILFRTRVLNLGTSVLPTLV